MTPPLKINTSKQVYWQFTCTYADWQPVYLLLWGSMSQEKVELFQQATVHQEIAVAYNNNVSDIQSKHVAPTWKGIGLAQELSRMAYGALASNPAYAGDVSKALMLLEAGDWIACSFSAISHQPFIIQGPAPEHLTWWTSNTYNH